MSDVLKRRFGVGMGISFWCSGAWDCVRELF